MTGLRITNKNSSGKIFPTKYKTRFGMDVISIFEKRGPHVFWKLKVSFQTLGFFSCRDHEAEES